MHYTWKLSGEAGFGITSIGYAFTRLCTRQGFYAFDYSEFPSLIRGGFTSHELIISDTPVSTLKHDIDLLIALRQDAIDTDIYRLTPDSIVLYDDEEVKVSGDFIAIPMPYRAIKQKYKAYQVMVNTVSVGATYALLGWDFTQVQEMIKEDFATKGQAVIDFNENLAKEGHEHIQKFKIQNEKCKMRAVALENIVHPPVEKKEKLVMTGNDAFAYGSIMAGLGAYTAYPMSPSSSVLATLAAWQTKTGIVVRHVEDEIAAANQALGFSFGGVRASTGTSGGGFALMVEAVSYAGIAEIPVVIFIAQRPGPATGLPTWTAQGDLLCAVHAGHGEFPKIILAPGDVREMIELTAKAYDLADIYQTPVIVLSDKVLSESHESVDVEIIRAFQSSYVPNRGKIVSHTAQSPYLRYKDVSDGISELLIPGAQSPHHWQANSYEHLEDTHTTEVATEVIKQTDKRARKKDVYLGLRPYDGARYSGFEMPHIYGDQDADTALVCWGGSKSVTCAAQAELARRDIHVAVIHFTHVYPLAPQVRDLFTTDKRYILVENNSEAQLGAVLRMELGIDIGRDTKDCILKYDGRPLLTEDIVKRFTSLL